MNPPKDFFASFIKKKQECQDTHSFYFDRQGTDLSFIPGHSIRMTLPIVNSDERGSSRFFSIASSPLEEQYFMITTRILGSSFKKTLATLTPGTKVKFFGPTGQFLLKEEDTTPRVLLAGGIGITPFHSMILYSAEKNLSIPLTLFVSFSKVEEILFYDQLQKAAFKNDHIKIIYTITHGEESTQKWEGEIGRISAELIQKYVPEVLDKRFYVVGPPKMVESMAEMIQSLGVTKENILKENFSGY